MSRDDGNTPDYIGKRQGLGQWESVQLRQPLSVPAARSGRLLLRNQNNYAVEWSGFKLWVHGTAKHGRLPSANHRTLVFCIRHSMHMHSKNNRTIKVRVLERYGKTRPILFMAVNPLAANLLCISANHTVCRYWSRKTKLYGKLTMVKTSKN